MAQPVPLALVRVADPGPEARAAAAVLEACHEHVHSHVEGWHEGPGSLVPRAIWLPAVRRLVDDLLAPVSDGAGRVQVAPLSDRGERVAHALYGEGHPAPLPDQPSWDGALLVVLGSGRSGTTWLARMLLAAPDAGGADGAESFLFKVCHPLWGALPRLSPVCDRDRLVQALRTFCDAVLQHAMQRTSPGARVFVEKTPLHSLMVPEVAALYPDAHFVHVVRDGRDVARSMSQVEFFGVPDPADAAVLWRQVLEQVRADAGALRHFREVRYEELLRRPVEGVVDLLAWAGLRHDTAVVPELQERAGTRVSAHAGTSQSVGTGTWQALSRRDLHRVLGVCGRLLVREGYLERRGLVRAALHPAYWSTRAPHLRARFETALRLR